MRCFAHGASDDYNPLIRKPQPQNYRMILIKEKNLSKKGKKNVLALVHLALLMRNVNLCISSSVHLQFCITRNGYTFWCKVIKVNKKYISVKNTNLNRIRTFVANLKRILSALGGEWSTR